MVADGQHDFSCFIMGRMTWFISSMIMTDLRAAPKALAKLRSLTLPLDSQSSTTNRAARESTLIVDHRRDEHAQLKSHQGKQTHLVISLLAN